MLSYVDYLKRNVLAYAITSKDVLIVKLISSLYIEMYENEIKYSSKTPTKTLKELLDLETNKQLANHLSFTEVISFLNSLEITLNTSKKKIPFDTLKLLCQNNISTDHKGNVDNQYWQLMAQKCQTNVMLNYLTKFDNSKKKNNSFMDALVNSVVEILENRLPIAGMFIHMCISFIYCLN